MIVATLTATKAIRVKVNAETVEQARAMLEGQPAELVLSNAVELPPISGRQGPWTLADIAEEPDR
jgi:hypothetical protein